MNQYVASHQQRRQLLLKLVLLLVSLTLTIGISSCTKPQPPTITPEKSEITAISNQGIELKLTLAAYNPNRFALKAHNLEATVELAKKVTLPLQTTTNNINLPANATTNVAIKLHANWQQAVDLMLVIKSGPQIPYAINGTVQMGSDKLNVTVPFKLHATVSQGDLIAAGLRGIADLPGLN